MSSNYIGSSEEALDVIRAIGVRDRLIHEMSMDIAMYRDALNLIVGGTSDNWAVHKAEQVLKQGKLNFSFSRVEITKAAYLMGGINEEV